MNHPGLIRRFLKGKWNLLAIRKEEKLIKQETLKRRYPLDSDIEDMRFSEIRDYHMDSQLMLVFVPLSRMIRLHPSLDAKDRALALAMLLANLSVTHANKPIGEIPTYRVFRADVCEAIGPEDNLVWKEFMEAIDLLLPTQEFLEIARLFPNKVSYAVQRIMNVPPVLVDVRMAEFLHKTDHTKDPLFNLKQPARKPTA